MLNQMRLCTTTTLLHLPVHVSRHAVSTDRTPSVFHAFHSSLMHACVHAPALTKHASSERTAPARTRLRLQAACV